MAKPPKDQHEYVQLGSNTYEIVPQPLPYLRRRLGRALAAFSDADTSNLAAVLTDRAYEVLEVFIPDLMPRWEWEGFTTEEAMQADAFDEGAARRLAPTGPQVRLALELCMKANGLDFYKQLGKFVDPTIVRTVVTKAIADSAMSSSTSSSARATDTDPTTSPTPSPTEAPTIEMETSSRPAPASVA